MHLGVRSVLGLGVVVLLTACPTKTDDDDGGSVTGDLTTTTDSATSNSSGIASFDIDVDSGDSFLLTAEADSLVSLEAVYDPSGDLVLDWEDWYYESESLTDSIFPQSSDVVFNFPIREDEGDLDGGTYTIELATMNNSLQYKASVDVDATIQVKSDSSMSSGTVTARIVYAEGLGDNSVVVDGTEAAVERWQEVWSAYGLDLQIDFDESDIDADLEWPDSGDSDLVGASEDGTDIDITVVVGETIGGSTDYYGVAGSIPGALVASPRSVVVISWLTNAGLDGSFSAEDIRLFGETLAHEVGHYSGLYHPVESDNSSWDALDDTSDCTSTSACESALGDNLMFWAPVCDWDSCTPQDELTDGQTGVMHRYTGTL